MKDKLFFFISIQTLMIGSLFAQEGDMPPRDSGIWQTVMMIGIAMLFFYFILWRPEQKRRKALDDQRNNMKKGDRVVAMGIVGTIVRVDERTLILKMVDGGKIEVLKGMITEVTAGSEEEPKNND
ncbi:MAG TPA: preprotein translocase subunit YajC [Waddliaceae bacterium]